MVAGIRDEGVPAIFFLGKVEKIYRSGKERGKNGILAIKNVGGSICDDTKEFLSLE